MRTTGESTAQIAEETSSTFSRNRVSNSTLPRSPFSAFSRLVADVRSLMMWDPEALDSLDDAAIGDVLQSWASFCDCTDALLCGRGDLSAGADLVPLVVALCGYGLCSLVQDHFLHSLEVKTNLLE
ncbi:hypothetical protein B296_00007420 [Ensete ventricosum]|uniref:Uncharacterized protein n=1 Tax=Ensete ventricosum TaxID=4639 RepID=A0A427BBQ0_ENSVE|nr:hypothetical protein B296_00007420 [Ensete ventricosum]